VSAPARASQHEAHTFSELLARGRALATGGRRRILGIAGAPGSGKSTLATRLAQELGQDVVVVPMDGFHLTNHELVRLGLRERKGAPDTFDIAGYLSLLRRLHEDSSHTVYAPEFDRGAEMSVAGAIAVPPHVPLVVTEGNYLLLQSTGWSDVRPLLDEAWFLLPDEETRVDRLIQRHIDHGKSPQEAREWFQGSDRHNGDLVAETRHQANVLVSGWLGLSVPAPLTDPVLTPRKNP
jgi:Panthothenate kinase